jgi:hypothetical protein
MAEHAHTAVHPHGDMPVQAQAATYRDVMSLFRWCALGVGDLILILTLWFCTAAGVIPAMVVGILVAALGVVALRGIKAGVH